jgi:hypothetical protein
MGEKQLLYIYGEATSGKTTLLRLLDGHPEVAVTPIHDKLPSAFACSNLNRFPVERRSRAIDGTRLLDLHRFQTALSKSRYNRFQGAHHGRPVRFTASSSDLQGQSMSEFDFYKFEERWIENVNKKSNPRLHDILFEIFDSLFAHWGRYPYDRDTCRYFTGLGAPNPESLTYTLENWPTARVVFMQRDPRGCVASKAEKINDTTAYDLLKQGLLYKVLAMEATAKALRERYPDRLQIVEFEELILESEQVVDDVRQFLDIADDPILRRATFCGDKLDDYNQQYIGEINDRWHDLLTADEKRLANLQLGRPSLGDLRPEVVADYLTTGAKLRMRSVLCRIRDWLS